jgi:hypothetical protein
MPKDPSTTTTGMFHISPRSVVLKEDAQEPLLFIPAPTLVFFEEVPIHARPSSFGECQRMNLFPEPAEPFCNRTSDCNTLNNVDCQESAIRIDIVPVIELEDDDGCIPESLLLPIV